MFCVVLYIRRETALLLSCVSVSLLPVRLQTIHDLAASYTDWHRGGGSLTHAKPSHGVGMFTNSPAHSTTALNDRVLTAAYGYKSNHRSGTLWCFNTYHTKQKISVNLLIVIIFLPVIVCLLLLCFVFCCFFLVEAFVDWICVHIL